ncbi:class F sortase [Rothia nasisuis]|uniref:class F sortase n=1 Tax=Rothia nasisuis TaxID=2109647 RepID=UPI001F3CF067|nr:class F sortase [Rothia nasisuis]
MKKHQALLLTGTALTLAAGGGLILTQAHQEPAPAVAQEISQAPAPASEFMDYQCPPPEQLPQNVDLTPGSWYSPALEVGASFSPSYYLPAESISDDGIIYAPSEAIESPEGASLLVGHVDLQPGAKSPQGGELTAWGNLHKLQACDLIYTKAEDGTLAISQVTSVIVTPQFDLDLEAKAAANPSDLALAEQLREQQEIESRIFRAAGDKRIVLMTCSGPSVEDVGGEFQFRYADNLIIETTPVSL